VKHCLTTRSVNFDRKKVGDRSIIGQILFVKIILFREGMTEDSLNCLGKIPVERKRLTMSFTVGRSIGRHWFKIDAGTGSRLALHSIQP